MDRTVKLDLPYIAAAQAQKHVTHNEAIRILDAIVQISANDKDLAAPPVTPLEGDRYLVAPAATGAWAGMDLQLAAWQDGAWMFYTPQIGWVAWVADENKLYAFDGAVWNDATNSAHQNINLVGVNATADPTNRLSVSAPATLFNHEGAGHQIKVNKNTAADTSSVLYQTGFSGRAEIGLIGNDDFQFKVSPDGATFKTALTLEKTTGVPRLPSFTVAALPAPATSGAGAIIFVSDEVGGAVLAFSDAANWRRVSDRVVVS